MARAVHERSAAFPGDGAARWVRRGHGVQRALLIPVGRHLPVHHDDCSVPGLEDRCRHRRTPPWPGWPDHIFGDTPRLSLMDFPFRAEKPRFGTACVEHVHPSRWRARGPGHASSAPPAVPFSDSPAAEPGRRQDPLCPRRHEARRTASGRGSGFSCARPVVTDVRGAEPLFPAHAASLLPALPRCSSARPTSSPSPTTTSKLLTLAWSTVRVERDARPRIDGHRRPRSHGARTPAIA